MTDPRSESDPPARGSTRSRRQKLRRALTSVVDGTDRSDAAVARIFALLDGADDVGFSSEMRWAVGRYLDGDLPEDDLVLMAEQVLGQLRAERRPEPRWRLRVPADARGLERRWTDDAGKDRAMEVAARLRKGKPLSSVAFGDHGGRLDLRGYVSPLSEDDFLDTRKGLVLDHVDLSGARLGRIGFTRAAIIHSRLEGMRWSGGGFWSTRVEDTSFTGSDLSEGTLAGRSGPANTFRRVDFRLADMTSQGLSGVLFEDCDFSNARLNGTEFHADLIRCRFAGHLHGTLFYGRLRFGFASRRFEDVDFSATDFHWAGFRGLDLTSVRLPVAPGHIIIRNLPCVLDRLGRLEREQGLPSDFAVQVAEFREWRGRNQQVAVFNERDLAEFATKDEVAAALSILAETQRACEGEGR